MKKDIIGTKINYLMSFSFIFILFTSFSVKAIEYEWNFDKYITNSSGYILGTAINTLVFNYVPTYNNITNWKNYGRFYIERNGAYIKDTAGSNCIEDTGDVSIQGSDNRYVPRGHYRTSGIDVKAGCTNTYVRHVFDLNKTLTLLPDSQLKMNIETAGMGGTTRDLAFIFLYDQTEVYNSSTDIYDLISATGSGNLTYNFNNTQNYNFNRLEIQTTHATQGIMRIFNFTLDIDDGSNNTLPTCDFNISKTMVCLQNTTNIDLNIDCTDTEGDTIYYSLGQFDYLNRYVFQEEKFVSDDFFTEGRFSSNYSYQDDISDANYYINSYSFTPIQIIAGVSGTNVLVTDTDVSSWSYKLDYPINNLTTIDYDIGFNTNESIVNMYTYSDTGVQQSNISFEYIGGNISIYADGNLIKNKQYGKFSAGFDNYFNIVMLMYPDQNKYYLVVTDDDEQYTIWVNNTFTQDVRTIKFNSLIGDVTNEYYILANLEVKGWFGYGALSFSQVEPTINDIDFKTGKIKLYVSDDVHQPISYNQYETSITVTTSEKICGEDGNDNFGQVDDSILGAIKQFFRGLSDGAGTTSYFQDAIFYVFIAMLVIIVISTKNMKLALTGASVVALVCSIVFGTITQILSYIIITAISTVYALVSQ